jgi:hypothetical protein
MTDYVIAYPGDRPPFICRRPLVDPTWRIEPVTTHNAQEARYVHQRDFPGLPLDGQIEVLAAYKRMPTRADHDREEREAMNALGQRFQWLQHFNSESYIAQRVKARAGERHNYRVLMCQSACRETINWLWNDEEIAKTIPEAAIAILALHGQGGPRDLGGPNGRSELPLIIILGPIWINFRAASGPAWCAALARVAEGWRIVIDAQDGSIVVENGDESCLLWRPDLGMELHPEVRAALRRVILGPGQVIPDATWRAHREWRVPQDISPEDDMRLRTALAMLVCRTTEPAATEAAQAEDVAE